MKTEAPEVPSNWSVSRLKFGAKLVVHKAEDRSLPYVGLEQIESFTGRLIPPDGEGADGETANAFEAGDVLFGKLRPYLAKAYCARRDGRCTSEALVLRPRTNRLTPRFLTYLVLSDPFLALVNSSTYGAKMPRASWDFIGNIGVPHPPIETQRAIADFLDRKTAAIDALIESKERLIALLEEKRQALITQVVTRGLDPNAPMKDSGIEWLGEIPAHWEVKRLKYLSPSVSVGIVITPAKYYDDEGTIPALRSLNIRERRIDRDNLVFMTQESNELLSKSVLKAGDLVAVRTGQPGKTAVVPPDLDGANCVDVIIIRQGERYSSDYLCEFMNSSLAHLQYTEGSAGAIQQHFNIETAKNLLVASPPVDEQRSLATRLATMHAREDRLLDLNRKQIARLREYRQAVITAAVTGELDVTSEDAA